MFQDKAQKQLEATIMDEIREKLPEHVATSYKKFIEDAEANKKELESLKYKHEELEKDMKSLIKELNVWKAMDLKSEDLTKRQILVEKAEKDYKLKSITDQLTMEQKSNEKILTLVDKVFGHPNVTLTNTKNYGENDQNGMNIKNGYGTDTITQTSGKV